MDTIPFLQLMQLADSAVPIGSAAHSWGLESLTAEGYLTTESLEGFLRDYLWETGALEAACCRAAYRLDAGPEFSRKWLALNGRIDARKPAREGRAASATLGRRMLQLAADLSGSALLADALKIAKTNSASVHHSAAFGLAGRALGVEENTVVWAYLHQSVTGLVSAAQRLMPLGQQAASRVLWALKPAIADAAASDSPADVCAFLPLPETASMRHPHLTTRLFVS